MTDYERISLIYRGLFADTYENNLYVFLCGGSAKGCVRNKIRRFLEDNHIQVLYPEDLFMEMMNRDKNANLIEYENKLADSVDAVVLICESEGAAAELGAFVQLDRIIDKLYIGIKYKERRNNSFIRLGPVKLLETRFKNKDNRIFYYKPSDLSDFENKLLKTLEAKRWRKNNASAHKKTPDFGKMPEYISLIPIILYFYQEMPRLLLYQSLKQLVTELFSQNKDFSHLFNASIQYLYKLGYISTVGIFDIKTGVNNQRLVLTDKGYRYVCSFLRKTATNEKIKLQDKIRCDILKVQLNN